MTRHTRSHLAHAGHAKRVGRRADGDDEVVVVEREVLELAARALARDVLALHRLRVRVDRRRGRLEVVGAVADDAPVGVTCQSVRAAV